MPCCHSLSITLTSTRFGTIEWIRDFAKGTWEPQKSFYAPSTGKKRIQNPVEPTQPTRRRRTSNGRMPVPQGVDMPAEDIRLSGEGDDLNADLQEAIRQSLAQH